VEKIGPYQILKELGRGGMGVVYRGVDSVIGRHVAIKTLRPEDMGESTERGSMGDRLLREARSAGILSHPSIVTIYQAGQDGDILYIAMEFVDGANLADVLAQGRLNIDAMLKILKQCAEALDYAHSKGVVHRDIKPGNILLEPSGKVKIADFGIAKLNQAGVTKTTSSVGSPAYMSPEHVRAQSIDGRADQYSLGVVAYEMLTGRRPHDSEELTSLVFKVVFEPPDLSLVQALPKGPQLEPIFSRVLAKAAEDRFASCTDFYEAFAAILEDKPVPASIQPPARPEPAQIGSGSGSGSGPHMATVAVTPSSPASSSGASAPGLTPLPQPASPPNKGLIFGLIGGLVLILGGGGYWYMNQNSGKGGGDPKGVGGGGGETKENLPPPVLIQQPVCAQTTETEALGVHGSVMVVFDVAATGDVENVRVSKSLHPMIDAWAVECVKGWRFQPSQKDGKAVRYPTAGAEIPFEKPK
jgi:TonB family protein